MKIIRMIMGPRAEDFIRKFVSKYMVEIFLVALIFLLISFIHDWELEKTQRANLTPKSAGNFPGNLYKNVQISQTKSHENKI